MATKIILKKSSVEGNEPTLSDLVPGEMAVNLTDRKLFTRDTNDNIITLGASDYQTLPIKADVALSKGDVLYATGAVGNSGTITVNKYIANNTIDELYLIGVAEQDLAIGEVGKAVSFGEIKGYDTSSYAEGTILYASPTTAGGYTTTAPTAPNQTIPVAMVISSGTNGILFIRPSNGFHLDELHDVAISSITSGEVLKWDGSKWVNNTLSEAGIYPSSNPNGYTTNTGTVTSVAATTPTGFTVNGSPITTSGTLSIAYDTGYQGYTTAESTKLAGIETGADVTDAGNVEPLVDTHLNTATATTGEVLSWNGTDYDWITAGGGAALELYAENPSSPTAPSATGTNAVAIGSGAEASATDGIAIGKDSDATGTFRSIGIGRLAQATGISSIALGYSTSCTSTNGNALGNRAQVAVGAGATAIGNSYASGTDSFAAAIANNTSSYGATGANSVAIGDRAKASSTQSFSLGGVSKATAFYSYALGYYATASNSYAYCLGGFSSASGNGSYAIGTSISATAQYSVAMGRRAKTTIEGQFAFSGEQFSRQGDSQTSIYVLRSDTTDATPEAMATDGPNTTRNATNQIILPNNSAYAFHGTIVARQQASQGTACAAWKVEGLIRREGSAGTTVLVNSATTVLDNTPSWGMALSADTTNGGLAITVTGAAATNIRWVATIHTSEVTY